jgi:hypothetical protein
MLLITKIIVFLPNHYLLFRELFSRTRSEHSNLLFSAVAVDNSISTSRGSRRDNLPWVEITNPNDYILKWGGKPPPR